MPTWLISLVGGPIISAAVDVYKSKIAAGNTTEKIAADLASRELQVQQAEIEADAKLRQAEIGRWYEPDHLMGYATALYYGKLLVWDKMLGLGSTEPLTGFAASTATAIVVCYYVKRGTENVSRILSAILKR